MASLVSENIRKAVQSEIKAQESLYKALDNQEKNYGSDLKVEKEQINAIVNNYKEFLKK